MGDLAVEVDGFSVRFRHNRPGRRNLRDRIAGADAPLVPQLVMGSVRCVVRPDAWRIDRGRQPQRVRKVDGAHARRWQTSLLWRDESLRCS